MSDNAPSTFKYPMTFEKMDKTYYPEWGFRPGTPCVPFNMNFVFINGGMGDYICWMQAIRWLASQATWIRGTLIHPVYLDELVTYWLKDYPVWGHKDYVTFDKMKLNNEAFRGPIELPHESLNATGAHLMTCGWVYFTNKEKAPEGWDSYPRLEQSHLDRVEIPEAARKLVPQSYAVITTGITTNTRAVPGKYWQYLVEYIKSIGLIPVFLGKAVVTTGNATNIHTRFSDDIDYACGVDLRNQTSLMQAASIMSRAAFVVGHDNGLLHLAGCTDVPIVFGYNLASPEHREPRRPVGRVYNVTLSNEELACNHCQSRTNFVIGFNFRECFYGDTRCIDMLFDNEAARWKLQIDRALMDTEKRRDRFG